MKIAKLGGILLAVTLIAAAILGFANEKTAALIAATNEKTSNESRKEVLATAVDFKAVDEAKIKEIQAKNPEVLEVHAGLDGSGQIVGYTVKTATKGYAGDVEVITGVTTDKKVSGVKLGTNSETPGLGTLAGEDEFSGQYTGKEAVELEVVKSAPNDTQILAITGATITSRAVTTGVNIATSILDSLN